MKKRQVVCVILMLLFISACSNSTNSSSAPMANSYNSEALADQSLKSERVYYDDMVAESQPELAMSASQEAPQLVAGRYTDADSGLQPEKIIKTGSVELSTDRFDSDKQRLEMLTREMGGFIERSQIYNTGSNRRFEAVLRVPGNCFSDMKKAVEETGKLISSSENAENVTSQYYDMESRLATKRVEEERILAMIDKAENVETLLVLEEHLGRVRTDIELFESQMKNIDSLSAYSTLNVYMTEGLNVKLMADTGNFGQRLWQSFQSSAGNTAAFFENVLVFLAGAVIPLALIALLAFTVLIVYKKTRVIDRK